MSEQFQGGINILRNVSVWWNDWALDLNQRIQVTSQSYFPYYVAANPGLLLDFERLKKELQPILKL